MNFGFRRCLRRRRYSRSIVSLARKGHAPIERSRIHQIVTGLYMRVLADDVNVRWEDFDRAVDRWRTRFGADLPAAAWPRLRERVVDDVKGHKIALQYAPGLAATLADSGAGSNLVEFADLLETVCGIENRAFRARLGLPTSIPTLVTLRVIDYKAGEAAPQQQHFDPSLATRVHRPANDRALLVRRPGGSHADEFQPAPTLGNPSVLLIAGSGISELLPFMHPVEHAVVEQPQLSDRLVLTAFLWAVREGDSATPGNGVAEVVLCA